MAVPIPDHSALAPAIRHFITQLLISEYDTDPAFASETARAWQIGRGAELHDAKLGYFQHIFGPEIGFCLFRSVLEARDIAWLDSRVGGVFTWSLFLSPALAVWTFARMPSPPSFPLLVYGVLLTGYAYLRPRSSYLALVLGVVSFCAYLLMLLGGCRCKPCIQL